MARPFENLKSLLAKHKVELAGSPPPVVMGAPAPGALDMDDDLLFLDAMGDVIPLSNTDRNRHTAECDVRRLTESKFGEDDEVLERLRRLVNSGDGLELMHTAEYTEGVGYNVHPDVARRLHEGRFSIQDHLDLHGYTLFPAWEALDAFLKRAVAMGNRAVLIIHGRGRSSPQKPVLKRMVIQRLARGPWRKWVLAFTSARQCDGGTGATYVLLRRRPVTKRFRKRRSGGL